MAKKSFNPALQFISKPAEIENEVIENAEKIEILPEKIDTADDIIPFEAKSRRVQLLMRPSLHDELKKAAKKKGVSFNEYVNKMLEKVI